MGIKPKKWTGDDKKALKAMEAVEQRVSFGPLFFMQHLRGLVRDRCPDPSEGIPRVVLHLMDGEAMEVGHIIGISPNWLALAVHNPESSEEEHDLRTELVPYHTIGRVTIESRHREGSQPIGFNVGLEPRFYEAEAAAARLTPEEALKVVAGDPPPAKKGVPAHRLKRMR